MRIRLTVTAALAAAALAGCGSATPEAASSGSPTTSSSSPSPSPSPSTTGSVPGPSDGPTVPPPADDSLPPGLAERPEVKAAVSDAAGRAGIVPGTVVIAGYSPVTWSDGSLGCPKKGMAYTQSTVEGELLLLRVDQRVMEYHARVNGPFSYCATPSGGYTPRAG